MTARPDWVPVAIWEVRRTLLRKDFLFSVLLIPVLLVGFGFLMDFFRQRANREVRKVAVVAFEPSGAVRERPLPPRQGFEWVVPPANERTREALLAAIRDRRYAGAVLLPAGFAERGGVELLVRRSAPGWKRRLEQEVQALARRERAAAIGLDSTALARLDAPVTSREAVALPAGKVSRADRIAAFLLVTLLIVCLFVSTSYMAIGITGEKQARVTEVVVSAIPAQAWVDGKIVAFTVIGLVQALLWVGAAGLLPLFFPMPAPSGVNLGMLGVAALMFVLGMVLYVSLFALILSTIKDLQSTSKLQAYLYFLPVIPFWFLEPAIENPDSPWVIGVSLVPFFSPFLVPGRMTVGGVAAWEIALAVVLLLLGAWLLRRAAGIAFRVAMLMYGKELTLPELVRWSKQA
jgi:ABC-2 type transport system permease protein